MASQKRIQDLVATLLNLEKEYKQIGTAISGLRLNILKEMIDLKEKNTNFPGFASVTVVSPETVIVDEIALRKILKKKDLPMNTAFEKRWVLSEKLLLQAIKDGKLKKKEINKISEVKKGNPYVRVGAPRKEESDLAGEIRKNQNPK